MRGREKAHTERESIFGTAKRKKKKKKQTTKEWDGLLTLTAKKTAERTFRSFFETQRKKKQKKKRSPIFILVSDPFCTVIS